MQRSEMISQGHSQILFLLLTPPLRPLLKTIQSKNSF